MKGLEALERINHLVLCVSDQEQFEQDLSTIEKELKALEIIKKKRVDIWIFQKIACLKTSDVNDFNKLIPITSEKLTQEEYDLLKEVLL